MKTKHFVFGGRFGDIIHSLPAVYEYATRTGTRPRFTAAAEFASVLEGCSYIEGYAAPVQWQRINDIHRHARNLFPDDDFCIMACYGYDYSPGYKSYSFLRESWRLSGCPIPAERVPLVFDKRCAVSEQNLIKLHTINLSKPFIVVCTNGRSSPFPHSGMLIADIRAARPDLDIVDISQARAHRVYDLVALFEKAVALVSIDTMHLHLALAVPNLPVFAFICNGPTHWNRTDWRPQQVWRCTYNEYTNLRQPFRESLKSMKSIPIIFHVWNHLGTRDKDTERRIAVAQESWQAEAAWAGNWQIHEQLEAEFPRLHEDSKLPYVHDVIENAIRKGAKDTDIISIANADIGCVQGITSQILDTLRVHGCSFAHRNDVHNAVIEKPLMTEAEVAERCIWYPGSDWFLMTVAWWRKHSAEMPDMVVGREFWDCVLRQIIKKHGGKEIHKAIWHEKHASVWEQPGNRQTLAGNKHNRALAMKFFVENRSNDQDPYRSTWNLQPGLTQRVDPKNTSMVERKSNIVRAPGVVHPRRLEVHQNIVRRIPR